MLGLIFVFFNKLLICPDVEDKHEVFMLQQMVYWLKATWFLSTSIHIMQVRSNKKHLALILKKLDMHVLTCGRAASWCSPLMEFSLQKTSKSSTYSWFWKNNSALELMCQVFERGKYLSRKVYESNSLFFTINWKKKLNWFLLSNW